MFKQSAVDSSSLTGVECSKSCMSLLFSELMDFSISFSSNIMLSYVMSKALTILPFDLIIVLIKLDSHLVFVVRMINSLHVNTDKEKKKEEISKYVH